jgi:2'-5' RNA ligase
VQTVELLLDEPTDAAVRAEWKRLADAGLPSQALHTGSTNAPHITVAVARVIPAEVERHVAGLVHRLPLPVELGALVVFGSRRLALARLVVAQADLLGLHAATAAAVQDCPGVPHYLTAGHWTPHVTLARGLGPTQVATALETLGNVDGLAGSIERMRRWDSERRRAWLLGDDGPELL